MCFHSTTTVMINDVRLFLSVNPYSLAHFSLNNHSRRLGTSINTLIAHTVLGVRLSMYMLCRYIVCNRHNYCYLSTLCVHLSEGQICLGLYHISKSQICYLGVQGVVECSCVVCR